MVYKPVKITDRAVTSGDSPYTLPIGVVTTYNPAGGLTLQFPTAQANDSVAVKNGTLNTEPVTIRPGTNQSIEVPTATTDTSLFVSHPDEFTINAARAAYRWINDGSDNWHCDIDFGSTDRVRWRNLWQTGTYEANDMVRDGPWSMIANKTTTDRAGPQAIGDLQWATGFGDTPPWTDLTNNNIRLYTGCRITAAQGNFVYSVRGWVSELDGTTEYELWAVLDPTGVPDKRQLRGRFIPSTLGWFEFELGQLPIPAGMAFDVILAKYATAAPQVVTGTWEVENKDGNPDDEKAWFQDNAVEIRVANGEQNGPNRYEDLQAIQPGAEFTMASQTWNVTDVANSGGTGRGGRHFFYLEPNQGRPGEDDRALQWTWADAEPIGYVQVANHWTSFPNIQGFLTTDYFNQIANPGLDENAYGVDVSYREAYVSNDWDLVAYSGN